MKGEKPLNPSITIQHSLAGAVGTWAASRRSGWKEKGRAKLAVGRAQSSFVVL